MYNRNLEKLIPIVVKIINHKIKTYNNETDKEKKKRLCHINTKFNGYFASYGPSVLMAGLYQTIFFYEDKSKCVNEIILEAMQKMEWAVKDETSLTKIVQDNNNNILLKNRILEVIVACKLAIRTFGLEEG